MRAARPSAQSGVRAQASAGVVGKGKGAVNPSKKVAMGRGKENEKAAVPAVKGKESDKERGKAREKAAARAGPGKEKVPFELNLWEPGDHEVPLELNFNTKPTPELLDSFGLNSSNLDTEEGKALEARIEEIRSELVFVKKMREPLPVGRELEPRLPWPEKNLKEMKVSKIPKGVGGGGLARETMKAKDEKERLQLKTGIEVARKTGETKMQ
ncbi:hypothetical protein H0H93_015118, partial [Arthromyces matolae]